MSGFNAIETSGNGIKTFRTWLDSIADNIANVHSVVRPGAEAFEPHLVVAEAIEGSDGIGKGSRVREIAKGGNGERVEYDPGHPYADADGLVRYPGVDMGEEMTHLIAAQRGYQANLNALEKVRDAYESALRIGR
jgi:flagellar basal-body rod protein FlgC